MKTVAILLGILITIGSVAQATAASARGVHRAQVATGKQFRNAYNSIDDRARTFCSQEAGNPYDEQTDYTGWSAWRQLGAWDSRYDC
jgi:hypothetical protein